MAIIYSYPIATPQDTDLLIISRTPEDPDEISNYSVDMSSVADYVIDEAFNGTDRYIPRFDGTSSLVNSVIYEDSNGNIGIGTTSPSVNLHIADDSGNAILELQRTGTNPGSSRLTVGNQGKLIVSSDRFITFNTDVSERMRVDYGGNVGIGTISPTHKLQVFGNGAFNSTLDVQDPDVSSNGVLRLSHDSTGSNLYSNPASSNVSTVVLRLGINNSEKMRIANNGNVGIETTSPSQKLDVNGDIGIKHAVVASFDDNNGNLSIGSDAGKINLLNDSLVIDYTTNVGIGTTSPSQKLHVVGNTKIEGVVIVNSANSSLYIGDSNTGQSSTSTGSRNVVIGPAAFRSNTSARYNTAVGHSAMQNTTAGDFNSVLGSQALRDNIDGDFNVAVGNQTMAFTTNSNNNTAVGYRALYQAQSDNNTGIGENALSGLQSSTSSSHNTGIGQDALTSITSGARNVGVGRAAGQKYGGGNNNVVTANDSVFIGADSDAGGDNQTNQIVIGYNAIGLGSNTVVLGNNSIVTTQLKGNVGIGTTSPASKLHILKTIDASGSLENNLQLKVENTVEDRPSGIEFRSNRNGSSSDSGAIAYTTTSATVSTRQIHLIPEIGASGDLSNSSLIAKGGGQVRIGNSSYPTKALEIYGTSLLLEPGSGQSFTFEHTRNANIYFEVNNQTVLTLGNNNGGNVGIGTTSPGVKLDVNGRFRVQDNGNIALDVNTDGAFQIGDTAEVGSGAFITGDNTDIDIVMQGGPVVTFKNSGNVGIGTNIPASKLEVDGGDIEIDDSASGLILRSPNGTRYRVQVDNSGNLTTTAI